MSFFEEKKDDEQKKFDIIYRHYRNLMYYVAYRILNNHHDAEDAAAEALCSIARNIEKIDEPICPKTKSLVVTITERKAIDIYRSKTRRREVELEKCGEGESGDYIADGAEQSSLLALAIAKLPKNYREVIILKFAQGYSTKEIAKMLGYSVAKVEKLVSRGKAKLEAVWREVSEE